MSDPLASPATLEAFGRAAQARHAIADIVGDVRRGDLDLAGAFERADADPLTARCFAVKVFEALPGIGKVRARRTMDDLGIDEDVWLGRLSSDQRRLALDAFDGTDSLGESGASGASGEPGATAAASGKSLSTLDP